MGLLLAAVPASADFDVVLFFAVAQLPMYMLPALLLPLYRRLLRDAPR
jgi:BASS family bile acid:Na+ symporter